MTMPDSSAIDAALIAKLSNDAQLKALLPDGVFFDQAITGATQYCEISLVLHRDLAEFGKRALEDVLYQVKAITLGTSSTVAKDAAARIDALLENGTLAIAGYGFLSMNRIERVRRADPDAANPSQSWSHRGGRYRVLVTPIVT